MHIFFFHMTVAHFHIWTTVCPNNNKVCSTNFCSKTVISPNIFEGLCSTLRPVIFVISRNDIQRCFYAVCNPFYIIQLLIATFICQVTANNDGITFRSINFFNSLLQFFFTLIAWCYMNIRQHNYTRRTKIKHYNQREKISDNSFHFHGIFRLLRKVT